MKVSRDDIRSDMATMIQELMAPFNEQVIKMKELLQRPEGTSRIAQLVQAGATGQLGAPLTPADRGIMAARQLRALAHSGADQDRALSWVKRNWPDDTAIYKALEAGSATAGGFLIAPEFSIDIIELLRPMVVIRRMGPMVVPMTQGTLTIPKITAGSTASYIGESQNAPKTQPVFGNIVLTYKKLSALVPISNDLLRQSGASGTSADTIVRNDVVRAMAQREDAAFIRDDGTAATPRGLRHWAPAANVLVVTGTDTLPDIIDNLGRMIQTLKDANVPMTRPGWMFAPRTERRLMTIQNAIGAYVFRDEMLGGKLWGIPYATTTQIPTNLSTDQSEVYLVDFDDVVIGESTSLIVAVSTEAAYDDNGTLRSAFSLDQTVMRVIAEHDFAVRRDVAVVVLTAVRWGV